MGLERMRPPEGGPGMRLASGDSKGHYTPKREALKQAAIKAFEIELAVILAAAHHTASGHRLSWTDCERLHDAHQHVLRVLASLKGLEVPT